MTMTPELPTDSDPANEGPTPAKSASPSARWSPREQRTLILLAAVWVLTGITLYVESEYWFASLINQPKVHPNLVHKNFD